MKYTFNKKKYKRLSDWAKKKVRHESTGMLIFFVLW